MKTYEAYYSSRCWGCDDRIEKGDQVALVENPPRQRGPHWRMYHPSCRAAEIRADEARAICKSAAVHLCRAVDARMIVDSFPDGHERAMFFGRIEHGHRRTAARLWSEAVKVAGAAS